MTATITSIDAHRQQLHLGLLADLARMTLTASALRLLLSLSRGDMPEEVLGLRERNLLEGKLLKLGLVRRSAAADGWRATELGRYLAGIIFPPDQPGAA